MRVGIFRLLAAALLMCVAAAPPAAFAQARNTSILTGKITDDSGAVLPGATVTVRGQNLVGGAQSAITDEGGQYRFPSLPPGTYELTVEMPSFKTVRQTNVQLNLATTVTIDIQMSIASVEETITVTGESPVVDVKTSAANTQLDDKMLQSLPTGRFQPDVINLAPGVNGNVAFGGAQSSNALLIDGVDVSDPSGGSPWSFFNYNWVGEVQVVSLGANAEYGEFTGVAANSIIRSGGNRWEGLFEYWTTKNSWVGDNTKNIPADLQDNFQPDEIKTRYDTSAQIGGPIVKDKLFFFTGFQYFKDVTRPAGFNGGFQSEKDPRFITKITWGAANNFRIEGFYEKDKYDVEGRGASTTRPPETTVIEPSPEYNWNIKASWTINDKTLLDVRNGGYDGYFPLEPTPPNSRSGPPPHFDGLTGLYSVNAPYYARSDRNRNVTAVTLTKYVDNFVGRNHEFKFGFEFERSKLRDESGFPGGKYYYDYGGPYNRVPLGWLRQYRHGQAYDALCARHLGSERSTHPQPRHPVQLQSRLRSTTGHGAVDESGFATHRTCLGSDRRPQDGPSSALRPLSRRPLGRHVSVHGSLAATTDNHGTRPRRGRVRERHRSFV